MWFYEFYNINLDNILNNMSGIEHNKELLFTGHETFQCRSLWLKKGYDFINEGNSFKDLSSVVTLGVGKNMVLSIRFWMKAFDIIDDEDKITDFGRLLLDDKGYDPYLEDEGSLWLLHYKIVTKNYSSTYNLIFNEFRKEKIEFTKESYVKFINRKCSEYALKEAKENTILDDFSVMSKLYMRADSQNKDKEENYSGLLTDLNLINNIGSRNEEVLVVENTEKENLPNEILLYCLVDAGGFESSINLNKIESEYNNVGSVFAINRIGLTKKIEEIISQEKSIIYSDYAGIKELQFKKKINPSTILDKYYAKKN
jgi:hypothetical protein